MIYSTKEQAAAEPQKGGELPRLVYEISTDAGTDWTPQEANAHDAALRTGRYKTATFANIRTHHV